MRLVTNRPLFQRGLDIKHGHCASSEAQVCAGCCRVTDIEFLRNSDLYEINKSNQRKSGSFCVICVLLMVLLYEESLIRENLVNLLKQAKQRRAKIMFKEIPKSS